MQLSSLKNHMLPLSINKLTYTWKCALYCLLSRDYIPPILPDLMGLFTRTPSEPEKKPDNNKTLNNSVAYATIIGTAISLVIVVASFFYQSGQISKQIEVLEGDTANLPATLSRIETNINTLLRLEQDVKELDKKTDQIISRLDRAGIKP